MWLMVTLGITSTNFDGLWLMILVASIYPVFTLFFMCCLLSTDKTELDELRRSIDGAADSDEDLQQELQDKSSVDELKSRP